MFGGYGSTHRIGDSLVKVSMIGMFIYELLTHLAHGARCVN